MHSPFSNNPCPMPILQVRTCRCIIIGFCFLICMSLMERHVRRPAAQTDVRANVNIPPIAFGVLMERQQFTSHVVVHSLTTVPQVMQTKCHALFSIPQGTDRNFTATLKRVTPKTADNMNRFVTKCPTSNRNPCRTLELLQRMRNRQAEAPWYFIAGQNTLFIANRVKLLVNGLDSDQPTVIGSGGLSNCTPNKGCQHVTHADVNWSNRTLVTKRLVGSAGLLLSKSAVMWLLDNRDCILHSVSHLNHTYGMSSLSSILRENMPMLKTIAARSFFTRPVDIELYFNNCNDPSKSISPVSFPFLDNPLKATEEFNKVTNLPHNADLVGDRIFARPWSKHRCADVLEGMRSTIYREALANVSEVAIIGIPEYANRGDSAIYVGERHLLDELNVKVVYETDMIANFNLSNMMQSFSVEREQRLILMSGGGNFGNHYPHHHNLRLHVMKLMPKERIVHFPNSICARDDSFWNETRGVFQGHEAPILLVSRDRNSSLIFNRHLANITKLTIRQCPDMAFYMDLNRLDFSRYPSDLVSTIDLLIHARMDKENVAFRDHNGSAGGTKLRDWRADVGLREFVNTSRIRESQFADRLLSSLTTLTDDWIQADAPYLSSKMSFRERAEARVVDGIMFLRRGKVVFTDRLHGHILLTLIQTPHVALDNIYKKVSAYHNSYLNKCDIGIQRDTLSEGTAALVDVLMGRKYNERVIPTR